MFTHGYLFTYCSTLWMWIKIKKIVFAAISQTLYSLFHCGWKCGFKYGKDCSFCFLCSINNPDGRSETMICHTNIFWHKYLINKKIPIGVHISPKWHHTNNLRFVCRFVNIPTYKLQKLSASGTRQIFVISNLLFQGIYKRDIFIYLATIIYRETSPAILIALNLIWQL